MTAAKRRALFARVRTADRRTFALMRDLGAALVEEGVDPGDVYPERLSMSPLEAAYAHVFTAALALDEATTAIDATHQETP